jgi:hypothetical protein
MVSKYKYWLLVFASAFISQLVLQQPSFALTPYEDCGQALIPGPAPWFKKITFRKTEDLMKNGRILSIRPLGEFQEASGKKKSGTHSVYILSFEGGVKAAWKPDGDPGIEVGAYRAARLIGSRQVPPTVVRTISAEGVDLNAVAPAVFGEVQGRTGSAQYFVDSSIDLLGGKLSKQEVFAKIPQKQISDRLLFNFVFGQWDAHMGNIIVDDSYSIALIDNGAINSRLAVRYGELPFRCNMGVKPSARIAPEKEPATFPFDQAVTLNNPTKEQFADFMNARLEPSQIDAFWKWREKSKDNTMAIVVWRNAVWIQGIGFQNYGPQKPDVFSASTIEGYRSLNFDNLRKALPPVFADDRIREMLGRRDQVLRAVATTPMIP